MTGDESSEIIARLVKIFQIFMNAPTSAGHQTNYFTRFSASVNRYRIGGSLEINLSREEIQKTQTKVHKSIDKFIQKGIDPVDDWSWPILYG